jgi:VanZ family protein
MSLLGTVGAQRRRWWAVVGWVAVILVITSWPSPPVPGATPVGIDKVVHFTMYGVLGGLVARAMELMSTRRFAIVLCAIAAFAAADEWHQQWIPDRGADVRDWMADIAGAAAGVVVMTRRARLAFSSN